VTVPVRATIMPSSTPAPLDIDRVLAGDDLVPAHDPGHPAAAARGRSLPPVAPLMAPLAGGRSARILVGTASWTDPTIVAEGVFYPPAATTPEARLRHYASRFPLVEVDATYYALPTARMAALWAERTPGGFVFDVKAHALMTGQPSEVARLPGALRKALPATLAGRERLYGRDLPAELYDQVWATFLDALAPLRAAGKLGAVLMQYPRWFTPTAANVNAMLDGQRRLAGIPAPVELRNRRWFGEARRKTERTLAFFERERIPLVMVDGPQGLESSVPRLTAATSPEIAVLRLHGRRRATWEAPGVPTVERYRYLYDEAELAEWVPRVARVAGEVKRVHVLFNNCHGNYGTTNAAEFAEMLTGERPAAGGE
jgi:uncharacterized protein YecE (DUF72 family)